MASSFPLVSSLPPTPARTQTSDSRHIVQATPKNEASNGDIGSYGDISASKGRPRRLTQSHRKLVFADPVAFRYLEEDESTIVLDRRRSLEGYELYVVEQWVCSRVHPTFVVCSFTGDSSHSILVNVLAVPIDQKAWSRRLKVYFDAISQSYAREKETQFGTLMVTNLSGFPSSLSVISVPDGDVRRHREDFIVNENLKRMGCSGRAAMNLQYPQHSTVSKFHHLYRTSERVPLYSSVMEIVRLCQSALVLYGKLESIYADGLLCDFTERSISDWWNDIGTDFHNVEPSDGIMGPTTVAALIGLMIGAFNRLKESGETVGKDPLDITTMKRAIGHFQKTQKMERTRRLDRETLDRLHRVTAKSATDEGFTLPRAIKSTVAELSGKGGEMIARGFGGGREKAGISEVETLDIDRLAQLVPGAKMRWLWQGKEIKSASTSDSFGLPTDDLNGRVFTFDDQGAFIWTNNGRASLQEDGDEQDRIDTHSRKTSRLRSNIGIPAARPHGSQINFPDFDDEFPGEQEPMTIPGASRSSKEHVRIPSSSQASLRGHPALNLALAQYDEHQPSPTHTGMSEQIESKSKGTPPQLELGSHRQALAGIDDHAKESPGKRKVREELAQVHDDLQADLYQQFSSTVDFKQVRARALRRSRSAIQLRTIGPATQSRIPRHLSFSIVSDPIFGREAAENNTDDREEDKVVLPRVAAAIRKDEIIHSQQLATRILQLQRGLIPFVDSKVADVEVLDHEAKSHLEELNNAYYQRLEEYQTLQATSTDLVNRERLGLQEGLRRLEMLGAKLDYELNALLNRMQEVEDGIAEFERNVVDIEADVKAMIEEKQEKRRTWYQRLLKFSGQKTQN